MNQRRVSWTVALCSAALFASLALPLVTGRVFVTNDLKGFHIPLRYDYQRALHAGDSVLWTSSILSGYYIHGEGQIGLYHPLHQALYRTLPLYVAVNFELLANYVAGFAGMYWLLRRRLALERPAALFGSMLFAFCGFNMLHHEHVNVVAVVAHLPWLLAATDALLAASGGRARALAFAGVALILASEILLGFPQALWWSVLASGSFALFRAAQSGAWTRLGWFAAALAVGTLLGGIQLLPTADMGAGSIRPLLPRDFALSFSLHPFNVIQFWSPYAFAERVYTVRDVYFMREFGIYSGALLMVALPWLWIRREALHPYRPLILALLAFAALSFVLALGRYGGISVLLSYVPVLGSLRAPSRYIVLCQFSLSILAAIAFADLLSLPRRGHRLRGRDIALLSVPALLSVLTTIGLNTHLITLGRELPFSSLPRAAAGTALVLLTTALVIAAARARWAVIALAVVTMVDLGLWGVRDVWRDPPQTIESLTAHVPPPTNEPQGNSAFVNDFGLPGNLLVLRDYRLASGYVGLPIRTNYHVTSFVSTELSGARWEFTVDGGRRVPMPKPVPRARLLDRVEVTQDFYHDVFKVDLHKAALLDHPIGPLTGPPGLARVTADRPGHIVVETSAPGRQLLSISERYHPGWRCTANGRALEVVAVHGDFLGCVVEAGTHQIDLRFSPDSFRQGVAVSLAGLAALGIAVAAIMRSKSP